MVSINDLFFKTFEKNTKNFSKHGSNKILSGAGQNVLNKFTKVSKICVIFCFFIKQFVSKSHKMPNLDKLEYKSSKFFPFLSTVSIFTGSNETVIIMRLSI